ncbi:MAG: hypothetical protein AAF597_21675 [Bacteroidota bacterium]
MPKTITPGNIPARFSDLVAMMPPRAIHDEIEYENTLEVINAVLARPKLTKGQKEYLETLTVLVESYEADHHAMEVDWSPTEALQYLLDQAGMTASDLGRLLGNRTLGSAILTGQRSLSKAHIRTLADHFKVEPGLFL